mmetsp:Transcript_42502/g.111887  ORF Transcript_42502/g.111887 Transcript_42502/m.111887 type:complete len:88 (+) Transcript_42502:1564-1827(+)
MSSAAARATRRDVSTSRATAGVGCGCGDRRAGGCSAAGNTCQDIFVVVPIAVLIRYYTYGVYRSQSFCVYNKAAAASAAASAWEYGS